MSGEMDAMDLIGQVMGEAFQGVKEEVEVSADEGSPPESKEEPKKDDLDFGDLPNGKIRYEKLKQKQAEKDARILELEREVARREGREEVLKATGAEEEDYRTDEEIARDNDRLRVEKLEAEINELKVEKQKEALRARDRRFFDKHPELDNSEYKTKMLEFIKSREGTAKDLLAGVTSMEEVNAMMNPYSSKKSTQDSSSVFGSTPNSSTAARAVEQKTDSVKIATDILRDPNSTNKAEATNALLDSLVMNFHSSSD